MKREQGLASFVYYSKPIINTSFHINWVLTHKDRTAQAEYTYLSPQWGAFVCRGLPILHSMGRSYWWEEQLLFLWSGHVGLGGRAQGRHRVVRVPDQQRQLRHAPAVHPAVPAKQRIVFTFYTAGQTYKLYLCWIKSQKNIEYSFLWSECESMTNLTAPDLY